MTQKASICMPESIRCTMNRKNSIMNCAEEKNVNFSLTSLSQFLCKYFCPSRLDSARKKSIPDEFFSSKKNSSCNKKKDLWKFSKRANNFCLFFLIHFRLSQVLWLSAADAAAGKILISVAYSTRSTRDFLTFFLLPRCESTLSFYEDDNLWF